MTITMDKKYKTRFGDPVRILCVDMKGAYPVVGIVEYHNTNILSCWTASGVQGDGIHNYDLIEVKPERVFYYNTYTEGVPLVKERHSIEECQRNKDPRFKSIGITKVTMVEGEHPRYEFIPE